jgi:hypothetical protein
VLTHSNIWTGALSKLAPKGTDLSSPFSWQLARAHYELVFAARAQAFIITGVDGHGALCNGSNVDTTDMPHARLNATACFESAVKFVAAHSPMGRHQFIAIPNVFMGALRGVATEWNGVQIFAPDTPNRTMQPQLSSAFRSSFALYLAPYLSPPKLT